MKVSTPYPARSLYCSGSARCRRISKQILFAFKVVRWLISESPVKTHNKTKQQQQKKKKKKKKQKKKKNKKKRKEKKRQQQNNNNDKTVTVYHQSDYYAKVILLRLTIQ